MDSARHATLRRTGAQVLLTLALATSVPARATVCLWAETQVDNLHVLVCADGGRWNYATLLYYKGLTQLLAEYARERVSGPAAKTVEIQVVDPVMNGDPLFAVEQDACAYKLQCRGLVGLKFFAQGLHYLASGYPLSGLEVVLDEAHLESFYEKMTAAVGEVDMSSFEGHRVVVLDLDRLKVVYRDDELFYELDGVRLDGEVQDPLPVDLGNGRFLLSTDDAAQVYENNRVVALRKLDHPREPTFCTMLYPGWVNIHTKERIALTYSRRTNTFYEVDVPHEYRSSKNEALLEYTQCEVRSLARIGFGLVSCP